jgi:hypothetical protein
MSSPSGIARPAEASHDHADASARARELAAALDRALAEGRLDALTPEALQALLAALARTYSAQNERELRFLPIPERSQLMDTDVMVLASALLKAVNLQVFELGMWQSWTGR